MLDIGLLTCDAFPDLQGDYQLLKKELENRHFTVQALTWSDSTIDWQEIENLIFCSVWDYHQRYDEFYGFLTKTEKICNIINCPDLIRWNIDKSYLKHFESKNIPVIPTIWLEKQSKQTLGENNDWNDVVIKPAIGAGSTGMSRFDLKKNHAEAENHIARLKKSSKVMIQPYFSSVDRDGETALVYFGNQFSHAVSRPLAGHQAVPDKEVSEASYIEPTDRQMEIGNQIISAIPFDAAYIRIDMIKDNKGADVLLEVEMIEPSLFLCADPRAAVNYADALEKNHLQNKSSNDITSSAQH